VRRLGEDESANPLFAVIEELSRAFVSEERPAWERDFLAKLDQEPDLMEVLMKPLARYRAFLAERLNLSGPDADVGELKQISTDEGSDSYRYLCVSDLFRAYEACKRTGKPVRVSFVSRGR
jgi:hypothetical protein